MKYKHYNKELLSDDFINNLISKNDFIDGRDGGLVLGNSHENGGIFFLYQFPEGFRVFGNIEGYEYIVNKESTDKNRYDLEKISDFDRDFTDVFESYEIPKGIKIIDARKNNKESKYILLDVRGKFAIINKYSTKANLSKIDFLNKK
ncbi:hypothetical protein [Algibacter sp. L3A6]|uniref:hypothetical protein n=1 Tax=Algibacter sp. L3A6 TaxID=2686366 RepID=UPI00131E990F|nr:hypothetical protein [Algibacter sp. L3A6]